MYFSPDIDEHRLEVARSMGADHVIKVTTTDPRELANQIEVTMGDQPDVSIECSAVDFSFSTALHVRAYFGDIHSDYRALLTGTPNTVELQWLEHLWDHAS